MAENTLFSSSGEEAIHRPVVINADELALARSLSPENFEEFYEIERTAEEISEGGYKRVRRLA